MRRKTDPFRQMHTIESMAKRIAALETILKKLLPRLESSFEKFNDKLSDVEIRNLFVMSKIAVPVKRSSIIYDGGPKIVQMSLLALFDEEKDMFIEAIMAKEEEEKRGKAARAIEDASSRIADAKAEGSGAVDNPGLLAYEAGHGRGDNAIGRREGSGAIAPDGQVS